MITNAAKIIKDVKAQIARDELNLKNGMTQGMRQVTEGAKQEIRAQVRAAGLGNKLSTTWRSRSYPTAKSSFRPAGLIWNKAAHIIDAFETGATVTAKNKKFLAIPTKYAAKRVGRQRLTPEVWDKAGYPKLRFVPRSGGGGMLVIDGYKSKAGKSFRTGENFRGGSKETLVVFILVRVVKHKKLLSSQSIAEKWFSSYPSAVERIVDAKR